MSGDLNRRQALLSAGAMAVMGAAAGLATPLRAANDAQERLMAFTGGAEPQVGRVILDMPTLAENGISVPLHLRVDSPMTADDHVRRVLILADDNPAAPVATFRFSPLSGVAEATTRIRLSGTQNVMAVAEMADGSFFMDRREVQVTIGGCGG